MDWESRLVSYFLDYNILQYFNIYIIFNSTFCITSMLIDIYF